MNIRLIILLAVPRCYIITPRGVASLRPQLSIAFSRHSACCLAVIQIPPTIGGYKIYIYSCFWFIQELKSLGAVYQLYIGIVIRLLYSKNIVFFQVQTVQQGPYQTVVCIAIIILYNGQVVDPQQGSFTSPSFLTFSISIFSRIFRVSIFYICSLATTHFIQNFLSLYLVFLLALLYLNLLLPLVFPLFLPVSYMPLISRLYIYLLY